MKQFHLLVLLITCLFAAGQQPLSNLNIKSTSGSEDVYAQSGWHYSLGDAERECIEKLDAQISGIISSLESQGKKVIGSTNYAIESEERENANSIEYRCAGSSEIYWVDQSFAQKKQQQGIDKGTYEKVTNTKPTFTVLEDELLNRFKKKYKKSYTTMEFTKISILESNVSVKDKISSLPSSFSEEIYVSENPTNTPQNKTVKISVSTTEGERISLDKSITTRNEKQFGFGFTAKVFNASGSIKQSVEMKIGSSNETSRSINRTYSEEFSQKVDSFKTLIIKIKREVLTDLYKLNGYLVFDGDVKIIHKYKDVYACGHFGTDRCSHIKTTVATVKLSQLLTAAERTLYLNGQATIASSENTKTVTSYAIIDLPKPAANDEDPLNTGKTLQYVDGKDYTVIETLPANVILKEVE